MGISALSHSEVHLRNPSRRPTRCLRIEFQAGAWHLSEESGDLIGGIFTSLSSAMSYARNELRGVHGGRIVVELDNAAYDGQP